jgi:hypothetical protein
VLLSYSPRLTGATSSTSTAAPSKVLKIGESRPRPAAPRPSARTNSPSSGRYVRRDLWRNRAIEIRVQFERNKNVRDPRAVASLLRDAEKEVLRLSHPDPYRRESASSLGGAHRPRGEPGGPGADVVFLRVRSVAVPRRNQVVRALSLLVRPCDP